MKEILTAKPSITALEIKYVTDAVTNGWGNQCYDYLNAFKNEAKRYLNVRNCWPTSSAHGALHIILKSLGIGPGDEVIVPEITWASGTVFPICWTGAKPVFADVKEDTWCLNMDAVESAISPKTKAIIAVHVYGNMVDMDSLKQIANSKSIPIIEDAAEAIGSSFKEQKAGTIADFGFYSFHGTKTFTTGEGGLITTTNDELVPTINTIEHQGRKPNDKVFWCSEIGLKYKLSNLQAALGLAQFERADELVNIKRSIFGQYQEHLKDWEDIQLNYEDEHYTNGYWQPTIVFGKSWQMDLNKRDSVIKKLNQEGIGLRPFFYPVSMMPMFDTNDANQVSRNLYHRGINLPSNFEMNASDIARVCDSIRQSLQS